MLFLPQFFVLRSGTNLSKFLILDLKNHCPFCMALYSSSYLSLSLLHYSTSHLLLLFITRLGVAVSYHAQIISWHHSQQQKTNGSSYGGIQAGLDEWWDLMLHEELKSGSTHHFLFLFVANWIIGSSDDLLSKLDLIRISSCIHCPNSKIVLGVFTLDELSDLLADFSLSEIPCWTTLKLFLTNSHSRSLAFQFSLFIARDR